MLKISTFIEILAPIEETEEHLDLLDEINIKVNKSQNEKFEFNLGVKKITVILNQKKVKLIVENFNDRLFGIDKFLYNDFILKFKNLFY